MEESASTAQFAPIFNGACETGDTTVTFFWLLRLLWTPAQRSLSEVHVMFCECYFFTFFMAALCSGPGITEVRETFTRGGPWVWTEKLLLGFFSWSSLNYRVGQKVTKFGIIFRPRPQTFCSHARTRQNIVILKKKTFKHRWLLYMCARFGELWPTNPWDPRVIKTNDMGE